MPDNILNVLIKVVKQGNGAEQTIQTLEKLKQNTFAATKSTEEFAEKNSKAVKNLEIFKHATGQHGFALLRLVGINHQAIESIQGLRYSTVLLHGGLSVATLGFAAAGLAIVAMAKSLDEAEKTVKESGKDLSDTLEKRSLLFKKLGLDINATREEMDAFVKRQISASSAISSLSEDRDTSLRLIDRASGLSKISRNQNFTLANIAAQRRGVGANEVEKFQSEKQQQDIEVIRQLAEAEAKVSEEKDKQAVAEKTLLLQQEKLEFLTKSGQKVDEQKKLVEQSEKLAVAAFDRLKLAEAEAEAVRNISKEQNKLNNERSKFLFSQLAEKKSQEQQSILEKSKSVLEDQFALEAKLKGIEDDRVARAIAYLNATGRTVDAQRLLNLELKNQEKITPLQQLGRNIARSGGLNVQALAAQGQTLGQKDTLLNLGSDFQRDFQRENQRLRKGSNRDEAFIQNQLAEFATKRLAESPTLANQLGAGDQQKNAAEKEKENLLKTVDIAKAKEATTKELKDLSKIETDFFKEFSAFSKVAGDQFTAINQKIIVLRDQLKLK